MSYMDEISNEFRRPEGRCPDLRCHGEMVADRGSQLGEPLYLIREESSWRFFKVRPKGRESTRLACSNCSRLAVMIDPVEEV